MFMNEKEIIFLFFFVTVLLLVLVYLTVCDLIIGRFIVKIFRE